MEEPLGRRLEEYGYRGYPLGRTPQYEGPRRHQAQQMTTFGPQHTASVGYSHAAFAPKLSLQEATNHEVRARKESRAVNVARRPALQKKNNSMEE